MTRNCLLDAHKRGGCTTCLLTCAHRIALEGLNGQGGRVGAAKVPSEYKGLTLATSPARTEQAEIYGMLTKYVATFERQFDVDGERQKNIYMWSDSPGTGKTTTAAALINEYIVAHYLGSLKRGIQPQQRPAYFLDCNAWEELYTGFTRPGIPKEIAESNSSPYYTQMELAKKTPFVVLDDIGVRGTASDAFRGDIHSIINYRDTNGLATIYTSNVPITKLSELYDARFYDRVRSQGLTLHFTGASHRGDRR
jgi:DNA replication protein DnaC